MKNWIKNILVISLFALIIIDPNILYSQTESDYIVKITQQVLPAGGTYRYEIDNNKIKVFKLSDSNKAIKVCSRNIELTQNDSIEYLIENIFTTEYDTVYSEPILDGVDWHFELEYKNEIKSIKLINYYIEEFDRLIVNANKLLPANKQFINMRMFLRRD